MEELIDLPDGKYILLAELAVKCKQLRQRLMGSTQGVIRCNIVGEVFGCSRQRILSRTIAHDGVERKRQVTCS